MYSKNTQDGSEKYYWQQIKSCPKTNKTSEDKLRKHDDKQTKMGRKSDIYDYFKRL